MQFEIENSVAAVLNDAGEVAGTAFLFRKDLDCCYWFTCHHVIANLAAIRLALGFEDGKPVTDVPADYVLEGSAPNQDVAVLKTLAAPALADYVPLPMGRVHLSDTEKRASRGIGFSLGNTTSYPDGQGYLGMLAKAQISNLNLQLKPTPEAIAELGNPWNTPHQTPRSKIETLMFSSDDISIEGGFSGSPVIIDTKYGTPLCVGMLCQVFKKKDQLALAIDFSVLFAAAGSLIPFHPYADCVVLTLVARLSEITPHVSAAHVLNGKPLGDVYSDLERDAWNCLGDGSSVKSLLNQVHTTGRTLQLASIYLDDFTHLKDYIVKIHGPLCFIVDCCSFEVPKLKEIFGAADGEHFHAAYLFPMPDSRFTPQQKDMLRQLREQSMPTVFLMDWSEERLDECTRPEEFAKRLVPLIEASIQMTMKVGKGDRMRQALNSLGLRTAPVKKPPTLSLGGE
jgi:hypothetical protein